MDLPGLPIQYSLDGTTWTAYDAAAKPSVNGKVWLRTTSFDGKRTSRVTELN
ncbi:Chitobiase precursor [compost metagenome]